MIRLDNIKYPPEPVCSDGLIPEDFPDALEAWMQECDEITIVQLQAELDEYRWIPVSERLPEGVGIWLVLKNRIPETFRKNDDSVLWKGFAKTYTHWKPIILPEK